MTIKLNTNSRIEPRHARPYVAVCALLLLITSCSSDATISEVAEPVELRQPMVFGTNMSSDTEITRASALQDTYTTFKVSTWKAGLETVMDSYEVDYTSATITDENYSYNWYYEGINGQLLRYWDLSAFPYEFRAVAPCTVGATIAPTRITINTSDQPFRAQTLTNDAYNIAANVGEPCVVAHVSREQAGTDFIDTDKIENAEINTVGKADATREVHVPFHHLISKIGFRIFIDNPQPVRPDWQADYEVWIENITISVKKDNFITQSNTYTATNAQGLQNGTFSADVKTSDEFVVLSHNLYGDTDQNLHNHLNKETAFDLSPNCMQQIPQQGVKVHVTMKIKTNHVEAEEQEFDYDSWISLDPTNEAGDTFTWEPEKKYIYFLHIPNLHGHEIYLHTCEILPWDEVQTTDIPIEL